MQSFMLIDKNEKCYTVIILNVRHEMITCE